MDGTVLHDRSFDMNEGSRQLFQQICGFRMQTHTSSQKQTKMTSCRRGETRLSPMTRVISICAIFLTVACMTTNFTSAANQQAIIVGKDRPHETSGNRSYDIVIPRIQPAARRANRGDSSVQLSLLRLDKDALVISNTTTPSVELPDMTTPRSVSSTPVEPISTTSPATTLRLVSNFTDKSGLPSALDGQPRTDTKADDLSASSSSHTATKFLIAPSTTEIMLAEGSTTVASSSARVPPDQYTNEPKNQHLTSVSESNRTTFNQEQQLTTDWSPRSEPFVRTSPTAAVPKTESPSGQFLVAQTLTSNNKHKSGQQKTSDSIDTQSATNVVKFADPSAALGSSIQGNSLKKHQQSDQNQFKKDQSIGLSGSSSSSNNNRWTHFGARLRPLTKSATTNDYHEAGTNFVSKLMQPPTSDLIATKQLANGQRLANGSNNVRQTTPGGGAVFVAPLNGNNINNNNNKNLALASNSINANNGASGDNDDDDDDDDLDSEALLYKMMQQQNFLMHPSWQQQSRLIAASAAVDNNLTGDTNQDSSSSPAQATNRKANANDNNRDRLAGSKKVIKLLKSYSHIHQVDDSDDQIRGTHTLLSSHRPQANRPEANPRGHQHYGSSTNNVAARQQLASGRTRHQQQQQQQRQQPRYYQQQAASGNQYATENDYSGQSNQLDGGDSSGRGSRGESGLRQHDGGDASPSSDQPNGPSEEDEFECPNNGIFADVASGCQSYHVCQSGAQVQEKFQCPLGTLFNNIILTCDFAHNVQCNGGAGAGSSGRASASHSAATSNSRPWPQTSTQSSAEASIGLQRQIQGNGVSNYHNKDSEEADDGNQAVNVHRPNQQQASQHVQTGSYPIRNQQQQGPRQLTIGRGNAPSPYNRHNQQRPPMPHNIAVGSYPPQSSLSSSSQQQQAQNSGNNNNNNNNNDNQGNNDNDDDDDDDAQQPLIPATLPPARQQLPAQQSNQFAVAAAGNQQVLPYMAPPQVSNNNHHHHQSAHLSQYPAQNLNGQRSIGIHHQATNNNNRNWQQNINNNNNDESGTSPSYERAGSTTPVVFASRDAAYSTSRPVSDSALPVTANPTVAIARQQDQSNEAGASAGNTAQSFQLVINHGAPAHSGAAKLDQQQQQRPPSPSIGQVYQKKNEQLTAVVSRLQQQQYQQQDKFQNQTRQDFESPTNNQVPVVDSRRFVKAQSTLSIDKANQQQQHIQSKPIQPLTNRQRYESQRSAQQHQQQFRPHAKLQPQQNYATESSQTSVVHQSPQVITAPGLVDLTNDGKKASGIGSEALNDGMLLIVRHDSGSASNVVQYGNSVNRNDHPQTPNNYRQGASALPGQAYAVDPTLVSPNSPIDAQLFPNVQRVVAGHHNQQYDQQASNLQVSHQQPQPQSQRQHYQSIGPRVADPLPPMAPPEPQRQQQQQPQLHHHQQSQQPQPQQQHQAADLQAADQVALSSSASASTSTSGSQVSVSPQVAKAEPIKKSSNSSKQKAAITVPPRSKDNDQKRGSVRNQRSKRPDAKQSNQKKDVKAKSSVAGDQQVRLQKSTR